MAIARGQLQHHFWGTYAATIAVRFETPEQAQAGLSYLPGWKVGQKHAEVLVFHGSDPALEQTLSTLETLGADRETVSSLAHSIDYGEPFTITIPDQVQS